MKVWNHFKTITNHKLLVMQGCFKLGLYKQGLLHDLSKYMPSEFLVGCKYYQGTRSPNNAEREILGYSSAWLHHKGRNKHHYEYWMDYAADGERDIVGMRMPNRYVVEMVVDRIAASKNYKKEEYTDDCAYLYYVKGKGHYIIHPEVEALLEELLLMLAKDGEEKTFQYIREVVLK
ncbi:MAG: DUF5662 family protein [Eubacteriales bacterium]